VVVAVLFPGDVRRGGGGMGFAEEVESEVGCGGESAVTTSAYSKFNRMTKRTGGGILTLSGSVNKPGTVTVSGATYGKFLVALAIIVISLFLTVTHFVRAVHRVTLGEIVHGGLISPFLVPSSNFIFLLVHAGDQEELLSGTVRLIASDKSEVSFRFCSSNCKLSPIISGRDQRTYALNPCDASSGRINISGLQRRSVLLIIKLDNPNPTPMEVALNWSD
jgi:hypothetical protein